MSGEHTPDAANGALRNAARLVVDRLAEDLSETNISIVLHDGDGRVIAGSSVVEAQPWDVATACAPITNPRTGTCVGSITLLNDASSPNPLLFPIARGAAREIERRMLDGDSARDRLLEERFWHARRKSRNALVVVGERTVLMNAAAADVLEGVDHSVLWGMVERAMTVDAATIASITAVDGSTIAVTLELVHQGPDVVGALLRLHTDRTRDGGSTRPALGWEALTGTERCVADLIAAGLTNRHAAARLYMSRYTVDAHLRHIYRKLDITSRVELTRIVTANRATALDAG